MPPERWIPRDISDSQLCQVSDDESLSSLDSESDSESERERMQRRRKHRKPRRGSCLGNSTPNLFASPSDEMPNSSYHNHHHNHSHNHSQRHMAVEKTPESIEQAQQQLRKLQQQQPKRRNRCLKTDLRKLNRSSPNLGVRMRPVAATGAKPRRHMSSFDEPPKRSPNLSPIRTRARSDDIGNHNNSLHLDSLDHGGGGGSSWHSKTYPRQGSSRATTGSRWGTDSASCRWSASKSSLEDQWSTKPRAPRRRSSRGNEQLEDLLGSGQLQDDNDDDDDDDNEDDEDRKDDTKEQSDEPPVSQPVVRKASTNSTNQQGRPQLPRRNQSFRGGGFSVETALLAATSESNLFLSDSNNHNNPGGHHPMRSPTPPKKKIFGLNRQASESYLIVEHKALQQVERTISLNNVASLDDTQQQDEEEELDATKLLMDARRLQQSVITEADSEISLDAVQFLGVPEESHPHPHDGNHASSVSRSVASLLADDTERSSTTIRQEPPNAAPRPVTPCVGSCHA